MLYYKVLDCVTRELEFGDSHRVVQLELRLCNQTGVGSNLAFSLPIWMNLDRVHGFSKSQFSYL